jgi:glycosyltransferase involved in cell wall biosynthesis|tara:strand:+ start:2211 stop:3296 length:1086 start_codon:yes stop_codon:yes gene_type:complete
MKILIVSGAGGGSSKKSVGKFFHLKEFGETLKKMGIEYKIVKETDYAIGFPTKKIIKYFTTKQKFNQLISNFKPDMVLVDRQGYFGLKIIEKKIPLFVLLRAHFWSELEFAKETIYQDKLMRKIVEIRSNVAEKIFAGCTMILPICNYLVDIVKEHHPDQKIGVFFEGIDSTRWYEVKGTKLKHPCVGLIQDANWWAKAKEMLLLKDVLEKLPDVHFYWAGDGQFKEKILPELEKFKNFHYLGSLEYPNKIREFLTEIDVYVLLTQGDTTPLSLKEAQLMKKPVIATDFGGIPEIMKDGITGYLIQKNNSKDLLNKILILINDEKKSKEMGEEGRSFIKKEFSLEASARNFLEIIKPYLNK